ncbi:MAG: response regulator [Candidatus Eisenbacteria bacterium]|nr:response regulator [Candidatus Latescibacterota bacterium]MBD3303279.1 response regulator [Candidatus Eisenbacteria bacterium]
MKERILVVDDDVDMAEACRRIFRKAGMEADAVYDAEEALLLLERNGDYGIVLTDLRMPRMDGSELLQRIKREFPGIDVVMMTGYGTIQNAIQAMKIGATDYITKPFDKEELLRSVNQILESHRLQGEVQRLQGELKQNFSFPNLIGRSKPMQKVFGLIQAARRNESSVLVVGESGTGKEVVARAIHYDSERADGPFVPVNCSAIPSGLIESELFGHKRGAFTGASATTLGLVRSADRGTLFLDEFAEMPSETQAKLLRVIQERRVRPVGDVAEVQVDVRFISATNRNVEEAVAEGRLRQDLFYRLAVIRVEIPPLRERAEDVPFLVAHFLEKFNRQFPNSITGFTPRAMEALQQHPWPGNVRQLENLIESLHAMGLDGRVDLEELPEAIRSPDPAEDPGGDRPAALSEAERAAIVRALEASEGNKSRAAATLRISRTRLYRKIREYGLTEYLD